MSNKKDEGQFQDLPVIAKRFTTYASNGGVNILHSGIGYLKSITFSQSDAAPTAGTISLYDSVATYGATPIFIHTQTTGVFMPVTVNLDIPFNIGLALGFTDAILDVGVIVKYKGHKSA